MVGGGKRQADRLAPLGTPSVDDRTSAHVFLSFCEHNKVCKSDLLTENPKNRRISGTTKGNSEKLPVSSKK